ncbi:MAG: YceI family protein [Anaerolineales bacterium]
MSNTVRLGLIGLALVAIIGGGVAAFIWFSGGDAEPSQDVNEALNAQLAEAEAAAPDPSADEPAEAEAAAPDPSADEPVSAEAADDTPAANLVSFRILTDESEARFSLQEDLRGQRVTVVGTTPEVAGIIRIDRETPANTQMEPILVNVRPLRTDNEFRDRAIRGQILNSNQDQYEFVRFTPTGLSGLPEAVKVGEPFTFEITGDLTVRDITRPETFTVTVTPVSETRIEGRAATEILRSNYDLTIPEVPSVANVTDEVQLEFDFAAQAES